MESAPWLSQINIRILAKQDLRELEWEGEYTHFRRVYVDAYDRAISGKSVLWIAEINKPLPSVGLQPSSGIVGQLFVQLICDRPELADGSQKGYIYGFRVRPTYRSGGLGTRMLTVAEADLQRRGFHIATLNVAQVNNNARRLYERMGYKVIAFDPGRWSYPDDKGVWQSIEEPAWRMEKFLRDNKHSFSGGNPT